MIKKLLFFFMLISCISVSMAQKGSISGRIMDTINQAPLLNGVICLLTARDSFLVTYTRSDKNGHFAFKGLDAGDYILMISFPACTSYTDTFSLQSGQILVLNRICLIPAAQLLQEAVVRQRMPVIRLRGDTTEFMVDSFYVPPNSTVEELLKKLPGIQIDRLGRITAQGKVVKRVLIDGEEFFNDDPTLVTQNLRADMISKVQVFEGRNELGSRAAVNNENKEKTINLKLKEDKKNIDFGKAVLSGGASGFYDDQARLNFFRRERKISIYGIASNTGTSGISSGGQSIYSGNSVTSGGYYNGRGIPSLKASGIHFDDRWKDGRQSVNADYKIYDLDISGSGTTVSENKLPGNVINYGRQKEDLSQTKLNNSVNGTYRVDMDSVSNLEVYVEGAVLHEVSNNKVYTMTLNTDSSLLNTVDTKLKSKADARNFSGSLLWTRQLRRRGRNVSIMLRHFHSSTSSEENLYSINRFEKNDSTGIVDQYKKGNGEELSYESKLTYMEPLSEYASLSGNYGIAFNKNTLRNYSYDPSATGDYNIIDSAYSSDYDLDQVVNSFGISYNYSKKNITGSIGNDIGLAGYKQRDRWFNSSLNRRFVNWYPQAKLLYSLSSQEKVILSYAGNSVQPTIAQIQPYRSNNDPLNIFVGNPSLKPSFQNFFSMTWYKNKIVSDQYFFADLRYSYKQNAITNFTSTDTSTGKTISQLMNINGNAGLSFYGTYSLRWKRPDIQFFLHGEYNYLRFENYVNGRLNNNHSSTYLFDGSIRKNKNDKYDIRLQMSAAYNTSVSSIQAGNNTSFWVCNLIPNIDVYLTRRFKVHADMDYHYQQKLTAFDNDIHICLLNTWIEKACLRSGDLVLKISCTDALDQNAGVIRDVSTNHVSQSNYTTVGRVLLASLIYNFNRTKGSSGK